MTTLRISGGDVLTPDLEVERADVLVDRATGEITAVGDIEGEDGEQTLDASGGLVIPGLVNAHTHVAMALLRGHADDKPLDRWLREDIWPIEAELTAEDVRAGAALGVTEMIKSGTTSFSDMYFEESEIAHVVEESGVRARLGHGIVTIGGDEADARTDIEEGVALVTALNGAADGRITSAVMPHSLTTVEREYLGEAAQGARESGVPLHYHANETREEVTPIVEEHGKRPLAYADAHGLLEGQDYIAHAVHLDREEIELLAETGTNVIHCPASNMKLASGIAPVQELLDAGITVGLGTDGAASNNDLDLFDELCDAAMVGKLAAEDASAVPADRAFEMATAGGADALGIDAGRIEPGRKADLAVVDLSAPHLTPVHDSVSHLVYAASGSDVRHTVCDGQVLMRDREVLTMDEKAVCETAAERAAALVARAEES